MRYVALVNVLKSWPNQSPCRKPTAVLLCVSVKGEVMKLDLSGLQAGEELLLSKKANFVIAVSEYGLSRFVADDLMWIAGLEGKEAIGGKLYVTNYRLISISHSLNRISGFFEIFLPAITKTYNSSRGMVMPPFLVGIISRLVFKRHVSCAAQVFGRELFRLSPC